MEFVTDHTIHGTAESAAEAAEKAPRAAHDCFEHRLLIGRHPPEQEPATVGQVARGYAWGPEGGQETRNFEVLTSSSITGGRHGRERVSNAEASRPWPRDA